MLIPFIKPITLKRLEQLERNSGSAKYQEWRRKVLERDENRCQYPGCRCLENLQIHHIRRFADARHLRLTLFNGITLCAKCHRKVTGNEGVFEYQFFQIALANGKRLEKKNQDKIE